MSNPKRSVSGFSSAKPVAAPKRQAAKNTADHAAKEQQALALISQGRLQEAETIYRELIAAGTKNPNAYGNLAAICGMQGRFDELIGLLKKALEIKPNYPEAHNNLGNALKEQGHLDAAIASYNSALELKPNYPDAHNNLGVALQEQGDLTAAIASYKTALQLKPNFPEARNNLGNAISRLTSATAQDLELKSFLRHAKYNGQMISGIARKMAETEKINKILLIRTPTTGGWIDALSFHKTIHIAREYYIDDRQYTHKPSNDAAFQKRESFETKMRERISRDEAFDLIVIDGFHDYNVSLVDFQLCFSLLSKDGVLLSHDCAPATPELAEPEFKLGAWSGSTYASLITYAASDPEIALTILDTDTGIGIARRRCSKLKTSWLREPIQPDPEIQSEFISLISSSDFRNAYDYFKRNSSSLVDFRSEQSR